MKTKLTIFLIVCLIAAGRSLLAGDSPEPSRGSALLPPLNAKNPAAPLDACCVEMKAGAPLTARSLYQLDAKWINDSGASVPLASLRGQPVVLAMFFASCEYACPILVSDLQRLRAALPPTVREKTRFVLVSFDTVRDTPPALAAYRERAALDTGWTLLHGGPAAVQDLAMLLGVKYKPDGRGGFAHSNLITVLNAEGEIAHQRPGLSGDISEAAQAVVVAVKRADAAPVRQ